MPTMKSARPLESRSTCRRTPSCPPGVAWLQLPPLCLALHVRLDGLGRKLIAYRRRPWPFHTEKIPSTFAPRPWQEISSVPSPSQSPFESREAGTERFQISLPLASNR